eukprot:365428-Chlamydomonas_euryale.AAC.3
MRGQEHETSVQDGGACARLGGGLGCGAERWSGWLSARPAGSWLRHLGAGPAVYWSRQLGARLAGRQVGQVSESRCGAGADQAQRS